MKKIKNYLFCLGLKCGCVLCPTTSSPGKFLFRGKSVPEKSGKGVVEQKCFFAEAMGFAGGRMNSQVLWVLTVKNTTQYCDFPSII